MPQDTALGCLKTLGKAFEALNLAPITKDPILKEHSDDVLWQNP